MTKPKITYCSGLAGSGKTAIIIDQAHAEGCARRRVLIVQPTKALINATKKRFDQLPPRPYRVQVFHSDVVANVKGAVCQAIRAEHQLGDVILMTHAAYLAMGQDWPKQASLYALVIDETFANVLIGNSLQMPESHAFITDHLTHLVDYKPGYSSIGVEKTEPKHLNAIKHMAENEFGDQLFRQVEHFAQCLQNDSYDIHVKDEGYLRMMREDRSKSTTVHYFAQLRPSVIVDPGWRSTMVYCACFQESLMYLLWQDRIDWVDGDQEVYEKLRYRDAHPGGANTTIYYCSTAAWSKRYRDTPIARDNAGDLFEGKDDVGSASSATYGEFFFKMISTTTAPHTDRLVWLRNKDQDSDDLAFEVDEGMQEMPACPHGLNDYMKCNWCVVTAAFNPPPFIFHYLDAHGINGDATRRAIYLANVYQAVMRSAVRDPDFQSDRNIIVMDKAAADYLGDLIPGSTIAPLPGCAVAQRAYKSAGRPKGHETAAARKAACVAKAIEKTIHEIDELVAIAEPMIAFDGTRSTQANEYFVDRVIGVVAAQAGEEVSNDIYYNKRDFVTDTADGFPYLFMDDMDRSVSESVAEALLANAQNFIMPFYRSAEQSSRGCGGVEVRWRSHDDFIALLLRWAATEFTATKQEVPLFAHAYFGSMADAGYRRSANTARYVYGVVIDVDDGRHFSPSDLADLFPRLRIATYSTHGSTAEKPKWRAWIPTTHLLSPLLYKKLCLLIEKKLNKAGFWYEAQITSKMKRNPKPHGIDKGKFGSASSIYYLPSSPIGGAPEFHDFNDNNRGPLNVIMWIRDACLQAEPSSDESEAAKALRNTLEGMTRRFCPPNGRVDEARIAGATKVWREAPSGKGDAIFFWLACRLADAGMNLDDLETKLEDECAYAQAGSRGDRRKQIPRIMTILRRSGTWMS